MLQSSLDVRGAWGEWTCVFLNPSAVYLKQLLQHCSLAIPRYKIKNSKRKQESFKNI